jgi:hypothetical protein
MRRVGIEWWNTYAWWDKFPNPFSSTDVYLIEQILNGEWKDARDLHGITYAHYLSIIHVQEYVGRAAWRIV